LQTINLTVIAESSPAEVTITSGISRVRGVNVEGSPIASLLPKVVISDLPYDCANLLNSSIERPRVILAVKVVFSEPSVIFRKCLLVTVKSESGKMRRIGTSISTIPRSIAVSE